MNLQNKLQQAFQCYQQRAFTDAFRLAGEALSEAPKSVDAWRLSGMIARASGLPQAEEYLRHAVQLEPRHPESLNALAGLLRDQGREDEAEELYRDALRHNPDHPALSLNLARQLLATGRPLGTLGLTRQLLAREHSAAALRLAGEAESSIGRPDLALSSFERAIALDGTSKNAALGKARALLELGCFVECQDFLATVNADDPGFISLKVQALAALGHWEPCLELALDCASRHPTNPEAVFNAAQILWMRGHSHEVILMIKTLESAQVGFESDMMCAEILRKMDFFDEAAAKLHLIEGRYGPSAALACARGELALEVGDTIAALTAAEQGATWAPNNIATKATLVKALLANGEALRARDIVTHVQTKLPDNQFWIAMRADALRQLGDPLYRQLVDFSAMVRDVTLEAPEAYRNIAHFNSLLERSLRRLHELKTHPLDQSLKKGSQTSIDLRFVDDPLIHDFLAMITPALADYTAAMQQVPGHPLYGRSFRDARPTAMWSVLLEPGGRHVSHIHPQGGLSCVYYVSVPEKDQSSAEGNLRLGVPPFPQPGPIDRFDIEATMGHLVIFPSYFWHGTIPAESGERLTIAFDIRPLDPSP